MFNDNGKDNNKTSSTPHCLNFYNFKHLTFKTKIGLDLLKIDWNLNYNVIEIKLTQLDKQKNINMNIINIIKCKFI